MPSVTISTGAFSAITDSDGMTNGGSAATSAFKPLEARRMPTAAPAIARTRLSTMSSRTILARPAPNAVRKANSFARTVARASIRFATLLHAIRSSSATAASTVYNVGLMRPTTVSPSLPT